MVIGDFDIIGIAIRPHEADPPLIIDANAILAPAMIIEEDGTSEALPGDHHCEQAGFVALLN